jgi:protein phosphatase
MSDDLARTDEFPVLPSVVSDPSALPRPFSSRINVELGAVTDRGLVRSNNEDHFLIARVGRSIHLVKTNLTLDPGGGHIEESGWVLAVADGMGGHASGEVASRLALLTGVHLVLDEVRWSLKINDEEAQMLMERMGRYVTEVHQAINEEGVRDPSLYGMGTTLTVAYSVGRDLFTVHVGDSRAYLYRRGVLRQLTHDHTVAQRLVEEGILDPRLAQHHRTKHVLTNVLGGKGDHEVTAEVQRNTLQDGDRLLLCSDGLTDMVPDEEIQHTLEMISAPQPACDALASRALAAGGRDNITVVMARFTFPADTGG